MRITSMKENKDKMHLEQAGFLLELPIFLFPHFLSDYEKDKKNVRCQSGLISMLTKEALSIS